MTTLLSCRAKRARRSQKISCGRPERALGPAESFLEAEPKEPILISLVAERGRVPFCPEGLLASRRLSKVYASLDFAQDQGRLSVQARYRASIVQGLWQLELHKPLFRPPVHLLAGAMQIFVKTLTGKTITLVSFSTKSLAML